MTAIQQILYAADTAAWHRLAVPGHEVGPLVGIVNGEDLRA